MMQAHFGQNAPNQSWLTLKVLLLAQLITIWTTSIDLCETNIQMFCSNAFMYIVQTHSQTSWPRVQHVNNVKTIMHDGTMWKQSCMMEQWFDFQTMCTEQTCPITRITKATAVSTVSTSVVAMTAFFMPCLERSQWTREYEEKLI